MSNFNAILSTITVAALIGLIVMNPTETVQLFNSLGSNAVNYVKTVQGR
jgi:hypothetical protein